MLLLTQLFQDLGLSRVSGFYRDRLFALAIVVGFAVVGVLHLLPTGHAPETVASLPMLVKWLLWAPVLEELLFRGIVQGQLQRYFHSSSNVLGLSRANWITSLLFTGIHFLHHPPLWAASVLLPSLVFGFFRDRHDSVVPSMTLHCIYNAQFLFLLG
ncbi:MAG: JDVT-CTERM system glutamic-type intramembrane protease [Gammaproteobacteria bacterium]